MNEIEIDDRFINVSPATLAAIRDYQREPNAKLVPQIVHGIVEKYLPEGVHPPAGQGMKAFNAFGIESITLMEVILDIQDALRIRLSDAELQGMSNFEQAIALLSRKVSALSGETAEQS
jgi:hypothetical protein